MDEKLEVKAYLVEDTYYSVVVRYDKSNIFFPYIGSYDIYKDGFIRANYLSWDNYDFDSKELLLSAGLREIIGNTNVKKILTKNYINPKINSVSDPGRWDRAMKFFEDNDLHITNLYSLGQKKNPVVRKR